MSRLLAAPALDDAPRELGRPGHALDPHTRAVVAAAEAEAYERGQREGFEAGHAAALAAVERTNAAVIAALDAAKAEMRALRAAAADGDVALAAAIATAVIGREPHDGGLALLARVREALALLDDRPLVVRANPADGDALVAGLADVTGLTVHPDPGLAPGEARIVGRWASADLTRTAAWDVVRAALDATGEEDQGA